MSGIRMKTNTALDTTYIIKTHGDVVAATYTSKDEFDRELAKTREDSQWATYTQWSTARVWLESFQNKAWDGDDLFKTFVIKGART